MAFNIPFKSGNGREFLPHTTPAYNTTVIYNDTTVRADGNTVFYSTLDAVRNDGIKAFTTLTPWSDGVEKQIMAYTGAGFLTSIMSPAFTSAQVTAFQIRLVVDGVSKVYTFDEAFASARRHVFGVKERTVAASNFVPDTQRALLVPDVAVLSSPDNVMPFNGSLEVYMTLSGPDVAALPTAFGEGAAVVIFDKGGIML